ncbi:unnamed protein product [Paramecium sonneborni]|uniref:Transmembrane protein n=1 Tax=Paramecium sonneborni TaxID=65129 RepID=A0A8S1MJ77_9CILI|nr:unnamed protein product [Paramecium sonneborni]
MIQIGIKKKKEEQKSLFRKFNLIKWKDVIYVLLWHILYQIFDLCNKFKVFNSFIIDRILRRIKFKLRQDFEIDNLQNASNLATVGNVTGSSFCLQQRKNNLNHGMYCINNVIYSNSLCLDILLNFNLQSDISCQIYLIILSLMLLHLFYEEMHFNQIYQISVAFDINQEKSYVNLILRIKRRKFISYLLTIVIFIQISLKFAFLISQTKGISLEVINLGQEMSNQILPRSIYQEQLININLIIQLKMQKSTFSSHFQSISPPFLLSKRLKSEGPDFLTQLDQNAQRSIQRRMQRSELQFTEPDQKPTLKQKQNIKVRPKVIRTKQPSLPYLKLDDKQYYDKWYIPYDQRYIQKVTMAQESYQDPLHFYKNMHKGTAQYDPFESKLPQDVQRSIEYKHRSEILRDLLRGQKMIIEFKKTLEQNQQRIPQFLKKILEDKKLQQSKK